MTTLTIIRGLPGSGKTKLAGALVQQLSAHGAKAIHFEAEQFFVSNNGVREFYNFDRRLLGAAHDECYGKTMRYLRDGYHVVVANTFSTQREVDRYLNGVQRSGLDAVTQVVHCPGYSNKHVPAKVVKRMSARWENVPGELVYTGE